MLSRKTSQFEKQLIMMTKNFLCDKRSDPWLARDFKNIKKVCINWKSYFNCFSESKFLCFIARMMKDIDDTINYYKDLYTNFVFYI